MGQLQHRLVHRSRLGLDYNDMNTPGTRVGPGYCDQTGHKKHPKISFCKIKNLIIKKNDFYIFLLVGSKYEGP